MLTLINDTFDFASALNIDCRKTNFNLAYYESEYDLDGFNKEFKSVLSENNKICDLSLKKYAKKYFDIDYIDFSNVEIINDFSGFNVAVYQGFDASSFIDFLSKSKAKIINFDLQNVENGHRFLNLDKSLAYKKAADIVLDAYDSGADFLVVGDDLSFKMFDTLSVELQNITNRDFSDFYILHIAEFIALANNKIPKTLKNHKLKVSLV